jgi:hypothetical protein
VSFHCAHSIVLEGSFLLQEHLSGRGTLAFATRVDGDQTNPPVSQALNPGTGAGHSSLVDDGLLPVTAQLSNEGLMLILSSSDFTTHD